MVPRKWKCSTVEGGVVCELEEPCGGLVLKLNDDVWMDSN